MKTGGFNDQPLTRPVPTLNWSDGVPPAFGIRTRKVGEDARATSQAPSAATVRGPGVRSFLEVLPATS